MPIPIDELEVLRSRHRAMAALVAWKLAQVAIDGGGASYEADEVGVSLADWLVAEVVGEMLPPRSSMPNTKRPQVDACPTFADETPAREGIRIGVEAAIRHAVIGIRLSSEGLWETVERRINHGPARPRMPALTDRVRLRRRRRETASEQPLPSG